MNKLLENVLNYIYPHRCPLCGKIASAASFCESCIIGLEQEPQSLKSVLQKLPNTFVDEYYACAEYVGAVKKGLHRLKFENANILLPAFAQKMVDIVSQQNTENAIIIPVPQSEKRKKETSVHLPKEFSQYIGKNLGLEVENNILVKVKNTRVQHSLTRQERLKNLENAFAVQNAERIKEKTIILCDDIVTTGATLTECAKVLKKYKAERVLAICFAATPFD